MIQHVIYRVSVRGVPHSVVIFENGQEFSIQYFSRKNGPMYRVFRSTIYTGPRNSINEKLFDAHMEPGANFNLESELRFRGILK